ATRIIPGYATAMDFAPRSLADDQNPCSAPHLNNRAGTERQFCLTDPTSAHPPQYTIQRHFVHSTYKWTPTACATHIILPVTSPILKIIPLSSDNKPTEQG